RRGALRLRRRAGRPDPLRHRQGPQAPGAHMTDDEDDLALRYPALPLAFQTTSPFISSRTAEAAESPPPAPEAPGPTSTEPWGMLDVLEPPATYGVDELAVLARDPWTLFTWWEATPAGMAAARAEIGGGGALVLRLHVAAVGMAPRSYDVLLESPHGQ